MDSEERREYAENEIEEDAISLGSEDTDLDGEDDDSDDDSFIVDENDANEEITDGEEDEFDLPVSETKAKFKRVIPQSESDDDDELINVKNKSSVDAVLKGSENGAAEVAEVQHTSNGDFTVEEVKTVSVAAEQGNPLPNNSKFEETDNVLLEETAGAGSEPKTTPLNTSTKFAEEDATADNTDTTKTTGKIAATFIETENHCDPSAEATESTETTEATEATKADQASTHTDSDQSNESIDYDYQDESIRYSINMSHPQINVFLKSINHCVNDGSSSSDDEEASNDDIPAQVAVERQPSNQNSSSDDQRKRIGPMEVNSSGSKAKTDKSLQKTPKQGKENVSENQLRSAIEKAASRSLQNDKNTSSSLASKQHSKKSANRSFGEFETNHTFQVNPLSAHFDANASNLRKSSTPNQKALLKTQNVAAAQAQPGPSNIVKKSQNASSGEFSENFESILYFIHFIDSTYRETIAGQRW